MCLFRVYSIIFFSLSFPPNNGYSYSLRDCWIDAGAAGLQWRNSYVLFVYSHKCFGDLLSLLFCSFPRRWLGVRFRGDPYLFPLYFSNRNLTSLLATLPDELWQLVSEFVPALDEFYKNIVWKWLADREDDFVILNYADDMKSVWFFAWSVESSILLIFLLSFRRKNIACRIANSLLNILDWEWGRARTYFGSNWLERQKMFQL